LKATINDNDAIEIQTAGYHKQHWDRHRSPQGRDSKGRVLPMKRRYGAAAGYASADAVMSARGEVEGDQPFGRRFCAHRLAMKPQKKRESQL
jgi:hypothetical protein